MHTHTHRERERERERETDREKESGTRKQGAQRTDKVHNGQTEREGNEVQT